MCVCVLETGNRTDFPFDTAGWDGECAEGMLCTHNAFHLRQSDGPHAVGAETDHLFVDCSLGGWEVDSIFLVGALGGWLTFSQLRMIKLLIVLAKDGIGS